MVRLPPSPRWRLGRPITPIAALALAALAGAGLVSGCGGSSPGPAANSGGKAVLTVARGGATTAAGQGPTRSGSTAPGGGNITPGLAYARCMRANGVSNFPDPASGGAGRFVIPSGPSGPAVQAAAAKCQKIIIGGGLPGSGAPATAQTMTKLVTIARCMRAHGISEFPDPRASMPAHPPANTRVITDYDGAILLFPMTLNMEAPAYRQALSACGAPPLGLPHSH